MRKVLLLIIIVALVLLNFGCSNNNKETLTINEANEILLSTNSITVKEISFSESEEEFKTKSIITDKKIITNILTILSEIKSWNGNIIHTPMPSYKLEMVDERDNVLFVISVFKIDNMIHFENDSTTIYTLNKIDELIKIIETNY